MKYGLISTKPFPFTIPTAPKGAVLEGKLHTTIKIYPHPDDTKTYPLQIDWKYRLSYNNKHFLSYICESKFIIQDDGIPFNYTELDKFIGDMYLNAEVGWENKTCNTPLHGSTMPALVGVNLDAVRKQILDNYNK